MLFKDGDIDNGGGKAMFLKWPALSESQIHGSH